MLNDFLRAETAVRGQFYDEMRKGCHGYTVFGKAVLFGYVIKDEDTALSKTPSRASPQTKVAIIAPRDEHCSRTYQIPIRMVSNQKFKRNICPMRRQRLNRFRRMLITRSDDDYFGKKS